MEIKNNNSVKLIGTVLTKPFEEYQIHEETFAKILVGVERNSGYVDRIPVNASTNFIGRSHHPVLKEGSKVEVTGSYRSFNKTISPTKSKLCLYVFAKEIEETKESTGVNIITFEGFVCKKPIYRVTPFGREVCDLMLAVNRSHRDKKSDYIPCIAWGRNATYAKTLNPGDKIKVTGRIQSREYTKKFEDGSEENRIAYEVSIQTLERIKDQTV